MVKILILGYSSIVRRRVLPALVSLGISHVDVASRSHNVKLPDGVAGAVFDDYHKALNASSAEVVYISTVNSTHAELAMSALECDRHVVIDKPAAIRLADVQRIVELASRKGLLAAEATVYGHHPQIAIAQRVFNEIGSRPTQLIASFSFPPLPPDNFRHRAELGGGALWDLGPYAVTPGRLFFADEPLEVVCRRFHRPGEPVESAFSLLIRYADDRSLVGHYGMTTGYINRLELLGPDTTVTLEPAFTTPADMTCQLRVNQRNNRRTIEVAAADTFMIFLGTVFEAISRGAVTEFADDMLAAAEMLDMIRTQAHPG